MDRFPVDSEEAREFRERNQDEIDEQDPHDAGCVGGWCGEDELDRAIPCRRCHPTLRLPGGRW